MNTVLVDESSFAFDSGSGEGISVHRKDFVYLDESEEIKSSVEIQGPSVGAPNLYWSRSVGLSFHFERKTNGIGPFKWDIS